MQQDFLATKGTVTKFRCLPRKAMRGMILGCALPFVDLDLRVTVAVRMCQSRYWLLDNLEVYCEKRIWRLLVLAAFVLAALRRGVIAEMASIFPS